MIRDPQTEHRHRNCVMLHPFVECSNWKTHPNGQDYAAAATIRALARDLLRLAVPERTMPFLTALSRTEQYFENAFPETSASPVAMAAYSLWRTVAISLFTPLLRKRFCSDVLILFFALLMFGISAPTSRVLSLQHFPMEKGVHIIAGSAPGSTIFYGFRYSSPNTTHQRGRCCE